MSLRWAILGLGLGLAAAACSGFSGAEPSPDAASLDGSIDPEAGAGVAVDFETDDGASGASALDDRDGGVEAGTAGCALLFPLTAFAVPAAADAVVCAPQNGLVSDGNAVGLDLKVGGVAVTIDGATVTTCLGVDFGAGSTLTSAIVRLRAVGAACGDACNGGCGTGDLAKLFAGSTQAGLAYVGKVGASTGFKTFSLSIPPGNSGRFVAVCRAGYAAARDDIEVDSISGCR